MVFYSASRGCWVAIFFDFEKVFPTEKAARKQLRRWEQSLKGIIT
jgi:hypothetical protein